MMKISEREKREREIDLHGPRDWSCPKQKAESVSNCSTISMGTFQLIISCARFNINSTSYFAPRPAPPLFFHEQAYPEWVQHMLIALHTNILPDWITWGPLSLQERSSKIEQRGRLLCLETLCYSKMGGVQQARHVRPHSARAASIPWAWLIGTIMLSGRS